MNFSTGLILNKSNNYDNMPIGKIKTAHRRKGGADERCKC